MADVLGSVLGIASGVLGGNSAATAQKASIYTQRDAYFSQLADAMGWNETQRQIVQNVLGPAFGLNITSTPQTPDKSGKIGGFIPAKFGQSTLGVTADPTWNPLDSPQWRNIQAAIEAARQTSQRGVAGQNTANQLAGHFAPGTTDAYYNQRNGEQDNAAARDYVSQQYAGQQNVINMLLNLASSKSGQQLAATQGLGQTGQQLAQVQQQQNASTQQTWAQIGEMLRDAMHKSGNSASQPTTDEDLIKNAMGIVNAMRGDS